MESNKALTLILSCLFLSSPAFARQLNDPIVVSTCAKTDHPALCVSAVASVASVASVATTQTFSPLTVLEKGIEAAAKRTQTALGEVKKMLPKDQNPNSKNNQIIDVCNENYAEALDDFKASFESINARDLGTLNSMLSAAVTMYGTCDDSFAEFYPDAKSPMKGTSQTLMQMVDNCLAIAQSIKM